MYPYVSTTHYSERIFGIEINGATKLILLNVYLPYDNHTYDSLDEYMQILADISAIIQIVVLMKLSSWVILTRILNVVLALN